MPARAVVYAAMSGLVLHDGQRIQLRENDPWDGNDPLVKARPELFSKQPIDIRTSGRAAPRRVEQATKAPGE